MEKPSLKTIIRDAFETGFDAGYQSHDFEERQDAWEEYYHNLTRDEPHTQED